MTIHQLPPEFPLAICSTCGGDGELTAHTSFACYDCNGVGFRWRGHIIASRALAPDLDLAALITPCCDHARRYLWDRARQRLTDYNNLTQRVAQGTSAARELAALLAKTAGPASQIPLSDNAPPLRSVVIP